MSIGYSYFQIYPRDEFERPVRQLYIKEERTPKYFAAAREFTHLFITLPSLSICRIGFERQCFSPVTFGSCLPLFQAGRSFFASQARLIFSLRRTIEIGLRMFSDLVQTFRFVATLFVLFVSKWSMTQLSNFFPQISGKANATSLCTVSVECFCALDRATYSYPFLGCMCFCITLPLIWLKKLGYSLPTLLSSERMLPRLDTSYKPSYPCMLLQVSIL